MTWPMDNLVSCGDACQGDAELSICCHCCFKIPYILFEAGMTVFY